MGIEAKHTSANARATMDTRVERRENRLTIYTPTRKPTQNVRRFSLSQGKIVVVTRKPARKPARHSPYQREFVLFWYVLRFSVGLYT